ncbi:MAG: biotin carboxylase N-terminal domain-containing protein [Candidatus Lokiarchaeota archaeon]
MIHSVLIANRGEIAVRIIRACRMNDIKTIVICSRDDENSLHVKMGDEVYCLGDGSIRETYLNIPKIISILKRSKAEAVHPGYGFLSENPEFARKVIENNRIFIGPSPDTIEFLGNKVKAKQHARVLGVPVVPGSEGVVTTYSEAKEVAQEIGYPLNIKSVYGGGGLGMKLVTSEEDLESSLIECQETSLQFFGRKEVFIEKFISKPRHIEIQFIGDNFGHIIHLGDRECSIQRSNQKLIEEAPSFLPRDYINSLGEKVCQFAKSLNYSNAGTAEFLWKDNNLYFNEVNPRIQVEHPVTEKVTGIDIVNEQLRIASNLPLSYQQKDLSFNGHAIEFRINAENPFQNNLPSCGKIEQLIVPSGSEDAHVRFDTFIYPNLTITNKFDSLLGKLIIWAKTRPRAIKSAKHALNELVIGGLKTNIEMHQLVIDTHDFKSRKLTTDFLNQINIKEILKKRENMKVAAALKVLDSFPIRNTIGPFQTNNLNSKGSWRKFGKNQSPQFKLNTNS